jgi:HEAT repeat protein
LLKRLPRSSDSDKRAVLRLLAVCGSEKSVPALLKLSRRNGFRDESLAAVEQIVGKAGLAQAVRQADDPQVRRVLIARLLSADEEQSHAPVRDFLSLVRDATMRGDALAAAETVPQLPIEALLTMLESDDKSVRLSAALVLGHVNGPEVTRHLVGLVTAKKPAPTEAWIALLACRGELAEEFLGYATRSPQLLGQVNTARIEWARMNL